jgi:hypothetical protein
LPIIAQVSYADQVYPVTDVSLYKRSHLGTETVGVLGELDELVRVEIDAGGGATDSHSASSLVKRAADVRSPSDSREIVDENWNRRDVHDALEEVQDSGPVTAHGEGEVA